VLEQEKKLNILNITIVCTLFIIGCVAGKLMMVYVSDTWVAFNGPAIGVLIIGEVVCWRIRKKLIKKWEAKDRYE
jgi:sugar phosphate permease